MMEEMTLREVLIKLAPLVDVDIDVLSIISAKDALSMFNELNIVWECNGISHENSECGTECHDGIEFTFDSIFDGFIEYGDENRYYGDIKVMDGVVYIYDEFRNVKGGK